MPHWGWGMGMGGFFRYRIGGVLFSEWFSLVCTCPLTPGVTEGIFGVIVAVNVFYCFVTCLWLVPPCPFLSHRKKQRCCDISVSVLFFSSPLSLFSSVLDVRNTRKLWKVNGSLWEFIICIQHMYARRRFDALKCRVRWRVCFLRCESWNLFRYLFRSFSFFEKMFNYRGNRTDHFRIPGTVENDFRQTVRVIPLECPIECPK